MGWLILTGALMTDGDVLVKILESHTEHQKIVEARLLAMTNLMSDSNERLARLEAAGVDTKLQRLSERISLLETESTLRLGGSKLLEKLPAWVGWFGFAAVAFWEYLRVTGK
jgi:hypothetical protein